MNRVVNGMIICKAQHALRKSTVVLTCYMHDSAQRLQRGQRRLP